MTLKKRLRQLASALPSDDCSVTITRAALGALLEGESSEEVGSTRDLTVEEVAEETVRAPSTVRGWLISKALRGYKLNNRDWRVPRAALHEYLEAQLIQANVMPPDVGEVDIAAWQKVRGA